MNAFVRSVLIVLAFQSRVWGQGTLDFIVNFSGQSNGVPSGYGYLSPSSSFYAAIYVGTGFSPPTAGTNAWILQEGLISPVIQFSTITQHWPSPSDPPPWQYYIYGTFDLTDAQVQAFLAGRWYAQVTISDTTYTGQFVVVPEPCGFGLIILGALVLAFHLYPHRGRRWERT